MNATEYMKHWEKNEVWTHYKWPKHQRRFRRIASMCEGETCADVGCGFGHSTNILGHFYPAKWTGIEFDSEATIKARELFPQYEFYCNNGQPIVPWSLFDTVVCSEVIEHIEDDKSFVEWLMSLTRIKLILTTPNCYVEDPGHLRIYNLKSLKNLFNDYVFKIKSIDKFYYIEVR